MHTTLIAASETRPVFWHFVTWLKVVWYVLAVSSVFVFLYGVARPIAKYRHGRGAPLPPARELASRLLRGLPAVFSQRTIARRDATAGLAHAAIFYGFLTLFAGTVILGFETDFTDPVFGWKYFQQLKANGARVEQSTTTVGTDVASGKDQVGVTLDSVGRSLLAQGANVSMIWPKDGSVPCPATIGITKDTTQAPAAKAFVTWMLSRQGQIEAAKLGYDAAYFGATPSNPVPKHEKQLDVNWSRITTNKTSILAGFAGIFG